MDDTKLPNYTLRYHASSVTALKLVKAPQIQSAPALLSGDASGQIAIWDLTTRRPIVTHTIKGEAEIVAIQVLEDNLFATLSKDHKLRIFRLLQEDRQVVRRQQNSSISTSACTVQECYHVPINTLNFANFLLQKRGDSFYRLICCNTQDSELIDVYTFHLSDLHSLKRVHKGINFYEAIKESVANFESSKVNKLGIVMKFAERENTIYCGFESGYVIGFRLHEHLDMINSNINRVTHEDWIEIVYVSSVHYPNPVLDLYAGNKSLLSSSIDDVIGMHMMDSNLGLLEEDRYVLEGEESVFTRKELYLEADDSKKVPASQISNIAELGDHLILSSWSGVTIVVNSANELSGKFSKSKSNVLITESPQGNLQGSGQLSGKDRRLSKVRSLLGISSTMIPGDLQGELPSPISIGQHRRIRQFLSNDWCLVGYEDGSIACYLI